MMRCDTLVQDICRTCLSVTSVSNLFQAICSDLPVVELLEKCIHHQPTVNDGLPPNMCITCMTSLYQTYVFISMCHRSMNILNGFAETQRQNINAPTSANEVKQEQDLIDEEITEIKFAEVQKLQDSSASAVDTELSVSTPIPESNADLEHEIKEELMIDETSEEATSPEPECSPYTCRFCDLSFTLFDDVLWHFQSKHGSSMSCILCTKTYQSERFAEYHIHSHGPKTYSCFPCRMNFRSEEELNLHKDSSEHVNRKMCPDCGKQFNTPGQLGVHKQTHTRDIKFICSECGHGFMYKSSYNRHLKIHAQKDDGTAKPVGSMHVCEICGYISRHTKSKILHEAFHKYNHRSICTKCKKTFPCKSELQQHLETEHTLFKCGECNLQFLFEQKYKRHLAIHKWRTERRTVDENCCPLCSEQYESPSELQQHVNFKHKIFPCIQCDKCFLKGHDFETHNNKHIGNFKYICKVCSKGFTIRQKLINHERTHTGMKPFACSMCDKAFAGQHNLKSHLLTHTGEKKPREKRFSCKLCDKSYANAGTLKIHEGVHTDEKPFKCDVCNKNFHHIALLRKHKRCHPYT